MIDVYKELEAGRVEEVYKLARFCYRCGEPIIDDEIYEDLTEYVKQEGMLEEYTNRTYDDDPIPYEQVNEFGYNYLVENITSSSPYESLLEEDKSLSIQALTDLTEVYQFFESNDFCDVMTSIKVNGVNSKTLYVNNRFELSRSRGRKGNAFNYSKRVSQQYPSSIDTDNDVTVFGEWYVPTEHLQYLRDKYDRNKYVTERGSAISMLRRDHEESDYKFLTYRAFTAEGVPNCNTMEEVMEWLDSNGFIVVPHKVIRGTDIPREFSKFAEWISKYADEFFAENIDIPSDGMVIQVNDLNKESSITGQYSSKNIAFKTGPWDFSEYTGIVEDILVEQRKVKCSVRLKIKPIRTEDGCVATYINAHNLAILVEQGIKKGSTIKFNRDSGAINNLIRK